MKINEIETLLGQSRANIRFYEKEGLLTPTRNENGYREYSEEDVAILKKIIIFRKLGLSLPDIKEILTGNLDLSVAMQQNIQSLKEQLKALNGALEVSQIIQNDPSTDKQFNEEHYWTLIQSRETNGDQFGDVRRDYAEFQKNSFLAMWEGPLFLRIRDKIKEYGWKSVLIFLLAFCIIRGIIHELWGVGGSFLEGFSYPFLLYGIISLATIPIFVLHRQYKDSEPEPEKPCKHPYLLAGCKLIGLVAYLIVYLLIFPVIVEDYFFLSETISTTPPHLTYIFCIG